MERKIKVAQVLLTLGEGGAQTYFEKMVFAFNADPDLDQRVITVRMPKRLERFDRAGIQYLATGKFRSEKAPHRFLQSQFAKINDRLRIKQYLTQFDPDVIVSYHNTAPGIVRYPKAVHIARMGQGNPMRTYENCDYIVANQPTLRHQVVAKGWPKDRIGVISNFAEFPESLQSEPIPIVLPENARIVLTLGRLHPAKAQDTLIEAFIHLPENTHLLIAGTGKLEKQLKDLANKLDLSNRVHLLGLRRDVPYLLDLADVVVLPSRYEPLGNVILEAWKARKPIVAANSDGPRWLIEHGRNGLLFEIDNAVDCAEQLKRIFNQTPAERERMVSLGSEKLEQQFSKEKIVGDYKSLFRRLLQERQS